MAEYLVCPECPSCDDRQPEIRGRDELPDWVVNRTLSPATEQTADPDKRT